MEPVCLEVLMITTKHYNATVPHIKSWRDPKPARHNQILSFPIQHDLPTLIMSATTSGRDQFDSVSQVCFGNAVYDQIGLTSMFRVAFWFYPKNNPKDNMPINADDEEAKEVCIMPTIQRKLFWKKERDFIVHWGTTDTETVRRHHGDSRIDNQGFQQLFNGEEPVACMKLRQSFLDKEWTKLNDILNVSSNRQNDYSHSLAAS